MDCITPGSSLQVLFRQEYWSGLPFPLPGDLPDPGIEPTSTHLLHWQVGSLPLSQLLSGDISPDSWSAGVPASRTFR